MKKYYVIPKLNLAVLLSAALLLGACLLRIVYYAGVQASVGELWLQGVLPVFAGLWLLVMLFTSAADRLHRTFLPVLLGLVFFAVKAAAFPAMQRYLCWALYIAAAAVYWLTVTRALNKWIFTAMTACALAYHGMVEDFWQHKYLSLYTTALSGGRTARWYLLAEGTVLMAMLALLPIAVAMVRRETDGWAPSWGDRNDGRRLHSITPIYAVSPYIMVTRNTASDFLRDTMECSKLDVYIRHKRLEGLDGFGVMHVVLAAYARCAAQYPGLNRFLSGQRIHSRGEELEVALVVKPEMSTTSTETVIKVYLAPTDTAEEVYRKLQEKVDAVKSTTVSQNSFDLLAKVVNFIPGLLLKFTVWFLKLLDYFGLLPRWLTKLSPFHGSLFITSMASLGIPPIYHHLYDFGNIPVFISLGKKYRRREVDKDGKVVIHRYMDYTFVTDERIVDGFYYASVLRCFRGLLQDPAQLDVPPETVARDVD